MFAQIVTENGVKKIKPLTADIGAGNPVGTIIPMYKKTSPSGYLYCDGSTFDETVYPLLYAYLGSNVLPDYREFALVGAEENTTDVYNASTNPTGTIHDHDIYTQGQAKDDQLQSHAHYLRTYDNQNFVYTRTNTSVSGLKLSASSASSSTDYVAAIGMRNCRNGTVTRGKRKAVFFYIKATSGLSENAQDNVVAQLNEERSYSTTEHATGKKWIDGKPIYAQTFIANASTASGQNYVPDTWRNLAEQFPVSAVQGNIDTVIKGELHVRNYYYMPASILCNSGVLQIDVMRGTSISANNSILTIYYTKTTD